MPGFIEADYENALIELLEEMGYTHVFGPDVEREFSSPLYETVLETAIRQINP